MKKYRAIVKSYQGNERKTRWYSTWAEAQRAGEKLSNGSTKSITVIDQSGYKY